MKVKFLFAWYDLWVGAFWDSKKRWLYILPFPMIGIVIKFPIKKIVCSECGEEAEASDFCEWEDCDNYVGK